MGFWFGGMVGCLGEFCVRLKNVFKKNSVEQYLEMFLSCLFQTEWMEKKGACKGSN